MLDGLTPELAPRLMIAIGGVAVAFLALIAILIFLKRRNSPLFIKGGRAREHRLLVLDAAAVDAKRRLVLIRRDDTEHLIMIGGPTDIVIETGIGGAAQQRPAADRPAAERAAMSDEQLQREMAARATEARNEQARRQRQTQAASPAAGTAQQGQIRPAEARAVSAMGAVLYDEDREPLAGAKAAAQMAGAPAVKVEGDARPGAMTTQAASLLDAARARVLSASPEESAAARNEDAVRALEAQLEASKAEAARVEAARAEAARAEAARAEAARMEAERAAAAKADAERAEAVRAEAARLQAQRLEAARAEAARLEAERAEAARLDAERAEAERAEAARMEAERVQAQRAEAARLEAERIAAARAEAKARFEAARLAQAERPQLPEPYLEQAEIQPAQWPVAEQQMKVEQAQPSDREPEIEEATARSQERLASDFEKLLEAELEADGVLDGRPAPAIPAERREPDFGAPAVNPVQRDSQPITGATPGLSIEQDMARRLGEISLNKKNDAL